MPNAAVNLVRALLARYVGATQAERESIVALSGSNAPFLAPPDSAAFAAAWPAGLDLATGGFREALGALVDAARELDPRIQKRTDRLVPRRASEADFWRNYFGAAAAALGEPQGEAADGGPAADADADDYKKYGLPPPRAPGKRRFAPGLPLQTSGDVGAEELRSFVARATAMVGAEETSTLVSAALERGGVPAASLELLQSQLEVMEWSGIDRRLGCRQLNGPSVAKDKGLHASIQAFQAACQRAVQGAVQRSAERANPDMEKRRFPPAAALQREGEVAAEDLASVVEGMAEWIASDETRALLAAAAKRGQHPTVALVRAQREYLEHRGLEQDFGMRAVGGIPARFEEGTGSAPRAAHHRLEELNERAPREALVDASRPEVGPTAERRFAPAGGELLGGGELPRDVALRFLRKAGAMLTSSETVALLAAAHTAKAPAMSMLWQREMLEHLGVEQDFGCRELSTIPRRFGGDKEMLGAFEVFQKSCVLCMKKAAEERQATGAADLVKKVTIDDSHPQGHSHYKVQG